MQARPPARAKRELRPGAKLDAWTRERLSVWCLVIASRRGLAMVGAALPTMWDLPRPKKRWYRRWWFTIPFSSLLLLAIAGGIVYWKVSSEYEEKAARLDYEQLEAMESASTILDRKGGVMGRIFTQNREQVPMAALSKNLVDAVIAREDARFYEHKGVDYKGVARALYENWKAGKDKQGASTLTQQLARNTFPDALPASDRTKERKLLEMFVAYEIERRCNKEKILELYLNRVFFGNGFYGAEAASRGYFGKACKDITVSEAALLAGLLRSPERLSPWRSYASANEERKVVLNNMLSNGKLTREQYEEAFADEPILKNKRSILQESHAADMVYQQVMRTIKDKERVLGDGLKIYTTIDSALQKKAENTLRARLAAIEQRPDWDQQTYAKYDQIFKAANKQPMTPEGRRLEPEYLQGAAVMLENHTGAILAVVGGRDFAHSALNRTTQVQVPPGTAFKPLVYAAAFEKGFFPGTVVQDAVLDNAKVMIGGTTGILGEWGPERADNRFEGAISARTALVKSKNGATARLGMMTGIEDVLKLAENAGISDDLAAYPKTYLGGSEVAPMDLTLAYTMFAGGGSRPARPFIIARIEDKHGNVLFQEKPETVQVIKETTAHEVHTCLAEVLDQDGTAERAALEFGLKKFPLGGKTGTAYNFTDLWFCGYSSEITCSVWIGFDQQRGKPKRPVFRGAFSKDIALPVWVELMKASFADYKPREFVQPKGIIRAEICRSSGGLACAKCIENGVRTTYQEICTEAQAPRDPCPVHSGAAPAVSRVAPGGAIIPRVLVAEGLTPVALKGRSVVGEDPYGSNAAVERKLALAGVGNALAPTHTTDQLPAPAAPAADTAPAAIAVPTVVPPAPKADVKLEQPEPIKFD
jgi:membrane carboxypeptidase/penicillin-binding protein